jgi:hypothetical protein
VSTLVDSLRSWAQNEEMIDASFTRHGQDCNEAAAEIDRLRAIINPTNVHGFPDWHDLYHKAAAERDHYKTALERIADTDPDSTHWFHDVATEALRGVT